MSDSPSISQETHGLSSILEFAEQQQPPAPPPSPEDGVSQPDSDWGGQPRFFPSSQEITGRRTASDREDNEAIERDVTEACQHEPASTIQDQRRQLTQPESCSTCTTVNKAMVSLNRHQYCVGAQALDHLVESRQKIPYLYLEAMNANDYARATGRYRNRGHFRVMEEEYWKYYAMFRRWCAGLSLDANALYDARVRRPDNQW